MASVPEPRRARRLWMMILLGLALILLLAAFVPGDRVLRGACVVEPMQQWTLTEQRPGTFESKAMDLARDRLLHYRLFEFDRPSTMDLQLPTLENGESAPVEKGEIVVRFADSSLDLQLAERRNLLRTARAHLDVLNAGAKPEEIHRAEVAVERARADLEAHESLYERSRRLHADGIASEQDWQLVQGEHRLKELALELAEAELRVLRTGAKPEEIEEVRVSIAGYEEELAALERMRAAQEIASPISGRLSLGDTDSLLLSAGRMDSMVVKVLLPQRNARYPESGQPFLARIPGAGAYRGEITRVDRRPLQTQAGTFLFAVGLIPNPNGTLEPGMQGRGEIRCGRTKLLNLWLGDLRRYLNLGNGEEGTAIKPLQGWGVPYGN